MNVEHLRELMQKNTDSYGVILIRTAVTILLQMRIYKWTMSEHIDYVIHNESLGTNFIGHVKNLLYIITQSGLSW